MNSSQSPVPGPVIPWKRHLGQRFVDAFFQGLGRRPQPNIHQHGDHLLGPFPLRLS